MKQLLTTIIILCSLSGFGQKKSKEFTAGEVGLSMSDQKKDTIVQVKMLWQDWLQFVSAINQNIDSKATTGNIINFLNQRRRDTIVVKPKK